VPTVSLHVHERIEAATILESVKHKDAPPLQGGLFDDPFADRPLREEIEFYKHERGWANRLIAGDSLLVMNSLLRKEGMAGKVQMFYFDPPYGIRYGSNFQPFVNKREVKDGKDEDLTREPEQIRAFRDTWELGIHSYLTYLRDRLLLARELLSENGSVFVQISDENVHRVRALLDELFGAENFIGLIAYKKTTSASTDGLPAVFDFLIWYAKRIESAKRRKLNLDKIAGEVGASQYTWVEYPTGNRRNVGAASADEAQAAQGRVFVHDNLTSQRPAQGDDLRAFDFRGHQYSPGKGTFKTDGAGLRRLNRSNRLLSLGSSLRYVRYLADFPAYPLTNLWDDTVTSGFADKKAYVVQTHPLAVERCLLMTTDPGDLVLDMTCGSATTAYVAEKWGRRWITCDTSRVAVALARQRLMTAGFDYYPLKYPDEGVKGGFVYKTVPHVTLKSIANNPEIDAIWECEHPKIEAALAQLNEAATKQLPEWEVPFDFPANWPAAARAAFDAFHEARRAMQKQTDASIARNADQEVLYDQTAIDKKKVRVTGPFTVEAVPFATVLSLEEAAQPTEAGTAVARSGESARQHDWRSELFSTGIRGKGGQKIQFAELETLSGTRWLHAVGTTKDKGERIAVSFGPDFAPLEQRQVELALEEAQALKPTPKIVVFAAFQFDPEAAKDIDTMNWPGVTLLKVQMNTDLLTEDLKKKRASNESFWLMGQPEAEVRKQGQDYVVEVMGFDYFNVEKGEIVSGGKHNIAVWMLDTDYDGRSLYPDQVFFPIAGDGQGWARLARNLKASLDRNASASSPVPCRCPSPPASTGGRR
jgi:adenine-specific DNA-methyltransferase